MLCLSLAACTSGPTAGSHSSIAEGGADSGVSAEASREVVTTGNVGLVDNDPLSVADAVAAIAEDAGGRVDARSESPAVAGGAASASLTLRIPADKLSAALEDIETAGSLVSSHMDHQDVTDTTRDLDARISALQTSVTRLLELMKSASSTSDLIDIESALSERQAELDSLTAQRDDIASRVDLATVSVSISTPDTLPTAAPRNFWEAIVLGIHSIGSFLSGVMIVFGVLLPWLILAAAITLLILYLLHRSRRPKRTAGSADVPDLVPSGPSAGPRGGRASYIPPAPPLPTNLGAPAASGAVATDEADAPASDPSDADAGADPTHEDDR